MFSVGKNNTIYFSIFSSLLKLSFSLFKTKVCVKKKAKAKKSFKLKMANMFQSKLVRSDGELISDGQSRYASMFSRWLLNHTFYVSAYHSNYRLRET